VLQFLDVTHQLTLVQGESGSGRGRLLGQRRNRDRAGKRILQKFLNYQLRLCPQLGRGAIGENEHRARIGKGVNFGRLWHSIINLQRAGGPIDGHRNGASDLCHQHQTGLRQTGWHKISGRQRHLRLNRYVGEKCHE
jgi:hypothetical protein